MTKRLVIIFLVCVSYQPSVINLALGGENVYVSRGSRANYSDPSMPDFLKKEILDQFSKMVIDIFRHIVESQNIQIVPELASNAANQTALLSIQNSDIQDIIVGLYEDCLYQSEDDRKRGYYETTIQQHMRAMIAEGLREAVDHPQFQRIVERALDQAVMEQQMITMQYASAQRTAQLQAIIERQAAMQQVIIQEYQRALALQGGN